MRAPGSPSPPTASQTREAVVLVADDTPDVRELLVEALHSEGYPVLAVANGAQALDALQRYPVAVLVLDLMMPHMSGWDVLRCLSSGARVKLPKIIVVSAAHDLRRAQRDPLVAAAIRKPFDLDHLLGLVENAMHPAPMMNPTA